MRANRNTLFSLMAVFIAILMLDSCKEKYLPEIKENNVSYLVVEGLINTGNDSTIFTLSRTFKLNNKAIDAPEKGAIVQVENEVGTAYVLPALVKAGAYGRPSLGLDPTKKYRLRIRTTDKREYLSDFVESKTSPPIDQLAYDFKNDNLNIFANTHDASGNSSYYSYKFVETWEYRVALTSLYKVENQKIVLRNWPEESIWTCWHHVPSTNVVLGTTVTLDQDQLADRHITSVQRGSLKLRHGYSILVKQSVLTKEGFDFFETLNKNTEQVGSVFDAQPSQLYGNVHSTTDPSEIVIGFISAGTVTEKRITLMPAEMPLDWFLPPPDIDSACLNTKGILATEAEKLVAGPFPPNYIFISKGYVLFNPNPFYQYTTDLKCADCRLWGGTNKKPSYWP